MRPVIILSCMLNTENEVKALIKRSNIKCDYVVVSQCDRDDRIVVDDSTIIFTRERGLSRSRNMAINNAPDDAICIISDDDEVFDDDVADIICDTYSNYPDKDLIAFALKRKNLIIQKVYPVNPGNLSFTQILRTSSVQITFKKSSITRAGIQFDEKMGSGTGNGGGEENKFLLDCRRKRLKLFYYPTEIATLIPGESHWFNGYTETFVNNLGWSTRRAMGSVIGFMYIHYWIITNTHLYRPYQSLVSAYRNIIKGYFSKR